MNCQNARELIENHFEQRAEKPDAALRDHLRECPDCYNIYTGYKKLENITETIRTNNPKLNDPSGLTDDIMEMIDEVSKNENLVKKNLKRSFLDHIAFRRSIAAAAVLLFALFSFEQYIVLDKVNSLEQKLQLTGKSNPSWERQTIIKYNRLRDNNKAWIKNVTSIQEKLSAMDRYIDPAKGDQKLTIN